MHIHVSAWDNSPVIGFGKTFRVSSPYVKTGHDINSNKLLNRQTPVRKSDSSEMAGQEISIKGIQAGIVYIKNMVTVELHKILDTEGMKLISNKDSKNGHGLTYDGGQSL